MEKVQLIWQLSHPYTFIPTSTVIKEMSTQFKMVIKGSSSYHLCDEYFSQFLFDSEMFPISAAVLKQVLIMYTFLN